MNTRNVTIIKSYKREINLSTRAVPSKKKFSRKEKHKTNY